MNERIKKLEDKRDFHLSKAKDHKRKLDELDSKIKALKTKLGEQND